MPLVRVLGLDIGEKRIGVAVSDPLGITAQSVGVIQRKDIDRDINEIKKIVDEYKAGSIVAGMPINMDGTKGESAKKVSEFIEAAGAKLNIPIFTYDERLTTKESEKFLISSDVSRKKRKGIIDKIAAQLILESYLDRMRNTTQV